jgi:hypothetical protein
MEGEKRPNCRPLVLDSDPNLPIVSTCREKFHQYPLEPRLREYERSKH